MVSSAPSLPPVPSPPWNSSNLARGECYVAIGDCSFPIRPQFKGATVAFGCSGVVALKDECVRAVVKAALRACHSLQKMLAAALKSPPR